MLYKKLGIGLLTVIAMNISFAFFTVKFVKLGQKHLGHPFQLVLFILNLLPLIFLSTILLLEFVAISKIKMEFGDIKTYGVILTTSLLLLNSLYWFFALLLADGCFGCGGSCHLLYFWIPKEWIL